MLGNRLPIRWRVTAAFAAVLTLVLFATGAFVFARMSHELDDALEASLQVRAREVSAQVDRPGLPLSEPGAPTLEADEYVAQILRSDGSVVAASTFAGLTLVEGSRLVAALRGPVLWDRPGDDLLDEDLRLLAIPVARDGGTFVVVVGASLDERNEALATLLIIEVLGLTAALLAASAAGYVMTGLALRPVEALRARADEITLSDLAAPERPRLPVPPAADETSALGRTLNTMLDRLAEARATERAALDRERRFVAEASHQLRTPLTIITSEVELAQLASSDHDAQAEALRSIGEEADRMARLADQLVLLAAGDEQRLVGPREPVAVGDLLLAASERHRAHAAELGRSITVRADSGLAVPADRARLEVALDSLVENALQHGAGDIEVSGSGTGREVVLSVRDRGPGFPAAVAAEAFERFRRGSRSSGTGLGLAIVQAVARAHGGQATIEPGTEGNTVSISLPSRPAGGSRAVVPPR
jgi:two-component system OmpR family sensor kinase